MTNMYTWSLILKCSTVECGNRWNLTQPPMELWVEWQRGQQYQHFRS